MKKCLKSQAIQTPKQCQSFRCQSSSATYSRPSRVQSKANPAPDTYPSRNTRPSNANNAQISHTCNQARRELKTPRLPIPQRNPENATHHSQNSHKEETSYIMPPPIPFCPIFPIFICCCLAAIICCCNCIICCGFILAVLGIPLIPCGI